MAEAAPRRVLLITDRYPPHAGGLARSSQRLARHALSFCDFVHVLVTRAEGPAGSVASTREDGLWVHRLGLAQNPADAGQHAAQSIAWLQHYEQFDLFHGQYASTGGFLAAYHAAQFGIASYVSLRGNDLDRDVYDPTRFAHLDWALRRAHAVGGVSRALMQQASRLSGRSDVRFTPNSVDGELFRPQAADASLRQALGLDAGPVLGFSGELRAKKGAGFLLDAFRTVAAETDAQLLIVGTVRPDERRALDQFRDESPALSERLHVCPYVQDPAELAAIYNLMDVLLSPSVWEGMPNSVLEAMACARPVLGSDAGGIPDLIQHGNTGWLLSRHQLHRLADALREVLSLSVSERLTVGQQAREHVTTHFTPSREQDELRQAYIGALTQSRSTH